MPQRDISAVAASAGALLRFQQRLVRLLRRDVIVDKRRPIAQRLGCRSVCLDCHNSALSLQSSGFSAQHSTAPLVVLLKTDDRRLTTTNSVHTPASSRRTSAARMLFSSQGDSLRTVHAAALCPENWPCAPSPLSL